MPAVSLWLREDPKRQEQVFARLKKVHTATAELDAAKKIHRTMVLGKTGAA